MQTNTVSRKVLNVLMALVMVVSLQVPSLAFAAEDVLGGGEPIGQQVQALSLGSSGEGVSLMASSWDRASSIAWTKGSGTADDPYLIESAANLAYLRDTVNSGQAANSTNLGMYSGVYFKQTTDIDLSDVTWTPIGVYSSYATARAFSGHYDGGGYAISGLKVNQACATGSSSTVGTGAGLFAYTKGNASTRSSISNLVVEGSVAQTASGTFYTAGLVGYAAYTDIVNCGNEATITNAGQPTAGITGNCYYSTIDGCFNHGDITSTYSSGSYAAGIAGQAANNSNFTTSITNSYNTGNVSSSYYAGGIVSMMYCGSTSAAHTLENCYNAGTMASTATSGSYAGIAGGIVGNISTGGAQYASAQKMTNCWTLVGSAPVALIGTNQTTYMSITSSGELTADAMKATDFAKTLGSKYVSGAVYPALYWEAPEGIPAIEAEALDDAAYKKGTDASSVTPLSVTASGDAASGDLVYQWYKASKEDLSDAQAIAGATANSYTPETNSLGFSYYYCTVHNDVQALDGSDPYLVQSSTAAINVWSGADAVSPVITQHPVSVDSIGQTKTTGNELVVVAQLAGQDETDANCELSYQWQAADSESGPFSDVEGAISATWGAPTSQVGTKYYRCVVTNTREQASVASAISNVASVTVVGLTIESLQDLKDFAAAVDDGDDFAGRTATLGADITVTGAWNPIGVGGTNQLNWKSFNGEFAGSGHTITFASDDTTSDYYALFGNTGTGAYIHDLVVDGTMKSSSTTVAGVVAQVTGATTLERVGNKAAVTSGAVNYATLAASTAGLVGLVSAESLTVVDCYNKGAIEGQGSRIGGLVGNIAATSMKTISAVTITSSYNTGTVTNTNTATGASGIGGIYGTFAGTNATLKNCYNTGVVTIVSNAASTTMGAITGATSAVNPAGNNVCYWLDTSNARGRGGTAAQPAGYISKTAEVFADEATDEGATGMLVLLGVGDYAGSWIAGSTIDPAQASPALYWEFVEPAVETYTITWANEDGTEIATSTVEQGVVPTFPDTAALPTKAATDQYTYVFDGWNPTPTAATENATYKATFAATTNTYTVAFDSKGGQEVDAQTVEYGATASNPQIAALDACHPFKEWQLDGMAYNFSTPVTGNITLTAVYDEVHDWGEPTYTWADDNSTVLAQRVCANDAAHTEEEIASATSRVTTEPGCETKGVRTWTSSSFKNEAFSAQIKTEDIPAIGHSLVKIDAVAATCEKDGVAEHWKCSVCGSLFADDAGDTAIETPATIPALGHAWGEPTYTWADDNSTVLAQRVCANDAAHVESETVETTSRVTKRATEEAEGVLVYTSAAFSNDAFEMQTKTVSIPKLEKLTVENGEQQMWIAGESADITATVVGLAEGETVVSWGWEYSSNATKWTKTGARNFADGDTCTLYIPECTNGRKPPMAWRVTVTTSDGRTATSAPQSLRVLEDLEVVAASTFKWVAGQPVDITALVKGLDSVGGEEIESYQWYYSKDNTTFTKTGAASVQDGNTTTLKIPSCTQARKAPMAWSVRVVTTTGRVAISEGISLVE